MSETADVKIVSFELGSMNSAGTAWLFRAPSAVQGGGITITDMTLQAGGTATNGKGFTYYVIKGSNAGTPVQNGTIVASTLCGTGEDSRIPLALTIATPYVALNEWVGIILTGTIPAVLYGQIHYLMGK